MSRRTPFLLPPLGTPGTFGDATNVPQITVGPDGRITKIANVTTGGLADHNHTGGGDGGDLTAALVSNYVDFAEGAAPGTPASGKARLYVKADGLFYGKDDAGAETALSGGGSGGSAAGTYAARPAASTAGALYFSSDSLIVSRDTGSAWQHYLSLAGPLTAPPAISTFGTSVNMSTSTIVDGEGKWDVTSQVSTGSSIRIRAKTAPGTPYTVTVGILPSIAASSSGSNAFRTGVGWRESGTSKIIYASVGSDGGAFAKVVVYTATNATTGFTNVGSIELTSFGPLQFLRLSDNGTNLKVECSNDKQRWLTIYDASRTAHMAGGPDQFCVMFDSNHSVYPNLSGFYHYMEA